MCTRYVSPEEAAIDRAWRIDRRTPWRGQIEVFPGYKAPFIRQAKDSTAPERELVVGQWSLIPSFAKAPKVAFNTSNARAEELSDKASYKLPWARGQRCLIPAESFFEPCWETLEHVPWRFRPTAGGLWGLAGIWSTWTDKATGEIHESYTMLTINADHHPLMSRMHRPDPKRPPNMQDKRMVIPIESKEVDQWLNGSVDDAQQLIRMAPVEAFIGEPQPVERRPKPPRSVRAQLQLPPDQGSLF